MNQQQLEFEALIAGCVGAVEMAFGEFIVSPVLEEVVRPFLVRAYERGVKDALLDPKNQDFILPTGNFKGERKWPMSTNSP